MGAAGGPYTVRRRGGRPWLAWLIILIVIGLIVWLIVAYAGSNQAAQSPLAGSSPVSAPITDLAAIVGAENRQALVGHTVSLSNVMVGDVVDNQAFWVTSKGGQIFVQNPNPQRVRRGDIISIGGKLEKTPDNPQQAWNVDPATAHMISEEGVYLLAGDVGGRS
jgi:hypothetical protein